MNRKFISSFLAATLTIFTLSSCFDSAVKTENVDAPIMKTINNYFDGRRNADIQLLKKTFIPTANLETIDADGNHMPISFEGYLNVVSEKGSVEVETQVMYLSITGKIAIAQTRFDYGDKVYMDYLTLVNTNQGWKITNKAFVKL